MADGATFKANRLWAVTGGAEKVLRAEAEKRIRFQRLLDSLADCSVCKGRPEIVRFGLDGNGVWIGCRKTEGCGRYIEMHTEGWSIENVAAEWNLRNRGICRAIRKVKGWLRDRFGKEKRAEKRLREEVAEEKRAEEAKRRDVFGISAGRKSKKWWKFCANGR